VTPGELVALFRREIDDLVTPYLWSEDDVYHYLDISQREFARLTYYFADASTPDVCQAAVTAGEKFVDISPLVIQVRRAKLTSQTRDLHLASLYKAQDLFWGSDYGSTRGNAYWETSTGTPRAMLMDVERDKGRLVPIPEAADTLEMMVYRYPLETVTPASTELEVADTRHQRILLHEMKSLAYSKHDSDVQNDALAEAFHLRFEQACVAVKNELTRGRDRSWTTRSAWI
jgi:hypothetical protein